MGHCVSHVKEETPLPLVHSEPDWSTINSIVVYGIPKDGTSDGLQWEVIISIDIAPIHRKDTRALVVDIFTAKYYSKTHFTNSLYYQLSTEKSGDNIVYFDTICHLDERKLLPTLSFEQICASYFEDKRLVEIKKLCMYNNDMPHQYK